jgi:iron(III) transport system permease protein
VTDGAALAAPARVVPPAGDDVAPSRRPPRPRVLTATAVAVAVLLLLPLAFLVLQAVQEGWQALHPLLFRQLTAVLLRNTISLAVVVTVLSAVIGTFAAWFVERTDLPGRRVWAVLVVLPVAVPDFAVAFGWVSVAPWMKGFLGAVVVMTLAVYPLVYLPVAASFRNADAGQEEVSRGLGVGRLGTFWRVTLGQARLAILGGCLLVALVVLAEYGAFEILGYQTLTTEIFQEFQVGFNTPAACGLSLVLVLLSLMLVLGEGASRGKGRVSRVGATATRARTRLRLGRGRWGVLAGFVALTGLALGVPLGSILYWLFYGGTSTLPPQSIVSAALTTAGYGLAAGLVATALAVPVALLSVRHPGRVPATVERSTYLVLAVPGLVVALALTFFTQNYGAGFLYQSSLLLTGAYAIMFFPLALVAVRTSLAQAPVSLEEVGLSLGRSRLDVLRRVTFPLVAPGLAAAFCLVFLETVTELTATLVLIPTGQQTLTTQFWVYQTSTAYHQAAPRAALMILIATVPGYVLGRWFDRLPDRSTVLA